MLAKETKLLKGLFQDRRDHIACLNRMAQLANVSVAMPSPTSSSSPSTSPFNAPLVLRIKMLKSQGELAGEESTRSGYFTRSQSAGGAVTPPILDLNSDVDLDAAMDLDHAQDNDSSSPSSSSSEDDSESDIDLSLKLTPTGPLRRSTRLFRRTRAYYESEEYQRTVPRYYLEPGVRDTDYPPEGGFSEEDGSSESLGGSTCLIRGTREYYELEDYQQTVPHYYLEPGVRDPDYPLQEEFWQDDTEGLEGYAASASAEVEVETPTFWIEIPPHPATASLLPMPSPSHDAVYSNNGDDEDALGMATFSPRSTTVLDDNLVSLTDEGEGDILNSPPSRSSMVNDKSNHHSSVTTIKKEMFAEAPSPQSETSGYSMQGWSIAENMAIWGSVDYLGLEGQWDQIAIVLGLQPTAQMQRRLEDEYCRLRRLKDSGILFNGLA
ncbi:hypothetical protein BGW39_006039 [Mortierella sp. 14UC]|nr:hypothetical protein BGW39_006039 [Mortierella sp. 14UC]